LLGPNIVATRCCGPNETVERVKGVGFGQSQMKKNYIEKKKGLRKTNCGKGEHKEGGQVVKIRPVLMKAKSGVYADTV